jgi:hypothetical protein
LAHDVSRREDRRLSEHFERVLWELRSREVGWLDRSRRARRAATIVELERYARAGRFPRNRLFPGRYVPCFVDDAGTRCAVGHLLEASGAGALVAHVRRTANHARIPELAKDPALQAWLDRGGLSVEEAARIQPEYCFALSTCACSSYTAAALVTVVAAAPGRVDLQVSEVEGEGAPVAPGDVLSLEAWSGASVGAELVVGYEYGSWRRVAAADAEGGADVLGCERFEQPLVSASDLTHALANEYRECQRALGELDPAWREHYDDNSGEPCAPSRFNCGAGVATRRPPPLGVGALSLVAALLWARLRRGRRARLERPLARPVEG